MHPIRIARCGNTADGDYDPYAVDGRIGAVGLAEERSGEQRYLNTQFDIVRGASRHLSDPAVLLLSPQLTFQGVSKRVCYVRS